MRFSQAVVIAAVAATVAAKPIVARSDNVKAWDDYNKCCEIRDKYDPKHACVKPDGPKYNDYGKNDDKKKREDNDKKKHEDDDKKKHEDDDKKKHEDDGKTKREDDDKKKHEDDGKKKHEDDGKKKHEDDDKKNDYKNDKKDGPKMDGDKKYDE
ncbi:uncharacterized protein ALTATR162_LOCUS10942 [Alternaria atra]|uniref:Uncharacterized protein n=1 Tax=Alternaria atra TaxID=119953 RepID=A0A8J2IGL1_9PLEO|nr:uncharacterized protein ALTATR162_LOCUS10942 [Alternaria atra]CAG5184163.1 unnamed protein product [Alternaria atra]